MKLKQISDTLGTAAQYDVGVAANNVVLLDSNGKLPAVDGSQLQNVSAGGGSESSSSIPKYTVTEISSTTIANYTSSGSPLDLSTLKSIATMDLFYIDMESSTAHYYVQLPAADSVNEGEYIVISRKATSNITNRTYISPASGDSMWSESSNATYYTWRSGSSMFISDGSTNWYQVGWGAD